MSTISAAASQFNAVTQRRTSVGVISMQQPRYFRLLALAAVALCSQLPAVAQVPLADKPVFSIASVPGNLALALSVEFPTAVSVAHIDSSYINTKEYLGYFDPNKCYLYSFSATEADRHFYPVAKTSPVATHGCSSAWSGNFLNWATMQTIDPFRWALTGGYRVVDTAGTSTASGVTIIEKAWASGQGGDGNFPNRSLTAGITASTPLALTALNMRVHGLGNKLRFTATGDVNSAPTAYNPGSGVIVDPATVYEVSVRVKVCDAGTVLGLAGLEANCVGYAFATYKPEGLLQKYSDRIRYSAFGYLNDNAITRDGGVLRARQAYVGPIQPVPLAPSITNPFPEWNGVTGVMTTNPVPADATATNTEFGPSVSVNNSGVLNYLNKFGQITPGSYKTYDPVGELYYAAVRYFKNLGNVNAWTDMPSPTTAAQKTTLIDGFPVITTWDDPILYSCQKNFILGIGDVNTHADKNVPGSSIAGGANENGAPTALSSDPVQATNRTNQVGTMQGLGGSLGTANPYGGCCNNNSALMAGVAYDSNTKDIRPDVSTQPQTIGKQTIQTYWLDVLEYSTYKNNNQFYLAAKYGGFDVPVGFDPDTATALPSVSSWYTTTRVSPNVTAQPLPDTYFVASRPDEMVGGLTQAFQKIASSIEATTTGAATALPQVLSVGNASYSASYKTKDWTSEVVASTVVFGPSPPAPAPVEHWKFSVKLGAQLAGTGWDTNRRMATWDDVNKVGIPFRHANLTAAQKLALDTTWIPSVDDSTDFLNYLRGDRTKESTSPGYRVRASLVSDIVGSQLVAVGRPALPLTDEANPGYKDFKSAWATRRTVLYVGSNGGVLHAINGALYTSPPTPAVAFAEVDANAGQEIFSYVPSALFKGPSSPSDPATDGLAALGNPAYVHRNFVNASPVQFDVDLANTVAGKSGTGSCKLPSAATNWKSILVGGLGKGGKSYYALDVTDPTSYTTESTLASKVMWEFPHTDDLAVPSYDLANKMGFSFGDPVIIKTAQHGWVVVFSSGYNNNDGKGYFFIVDACTGKLVHNPIATGAGSTTAEAGMAHPAAYVLAYTDGVADAIYSGDLLGNLWRLDIRAKTGSFPPPEKIALLKAANGTAQPVTSPPKIELDPKTLTRYVMVGTGRYLDQTDAADLQRQNIYAFRDGNNVVFDSALTTATAVVRSELKDITDSLTNSTPVYTNEKGWLIDVGKNESGLGWRVILNSSALFGQVYFSAVLPNSADICASGGSSLLYGLNFGGGKSVLTDTAGALTSYIKENSPIIGVRILTSGGGAGGGGGTPTVCTTFADGTVKCPDPVPTTVDLRNLNWREIMTTE